MPPFNRERRKRTIYLAPADEAAVETIRRGAGLRTKAGAIRHAVRQTERRFNRVPDATAVSRLIQYLESMTLLTEGDKTRLRALCAEAKKERGMLNGKKE